MAAFKRLTDAEARQMTRSELLDRLEAEQAYWMHNPARGMSEADVAAEREFSRIMHAYLSPGDGLAALRDVLEGRPNDYWERRPGDDPGREAGE